MKKIYVPCYTFCSTCGNYSGYEPLKVFFETKEEAEAFLAKNPNKRGWWGDGEIVLELENLSSDK